MKRPIPVVTQPKPGEQTRKATLPWEDPEFEEAYPTVAAYMTQDRWESGSIRQTATLTLFVENGGLTVILNDRANLRSLFVQESSLFSALMKINQALEDGTADWRVKRDSRNPHDGKVPF